MPKDISFREVKSIYNYYNDLMSNLNNGSRIDTIYSNELGSLVDDLVARGFFSNIAENILKGKSINLSDYQSQLLLMQMYCSLHSNELSSTCKHLYDNHSQYITQKLVEISPATNALSWFVASKQKKAMATTAYNMLSEMKSEPFVTISEDTIAKINSIKRTSMDIITEDFLSNISTYRKHTNKISSLTIGNIPSVQHYYADYQERIEGFDAIKGTIANTAENIKKAVNYLMAEELVNTLRALPVDELGRSRQNLKIKCLKDAGFLTLADVFGASREEIVSAHGISEDASYTIKSICEDYAKQLQKDLKIKLSVDNQSKSATAVVLAIYNYSKQKVSQKRIDELNLECGNTLATAFNEILNCKNNANWFFYSEDEINHIRHNYSVISNVAPNSFNPIADEIIQSYKPIKIVDSQLAWEDFAINSIHYYNIIEELIPGILGTDDSIYGLPEELARQIQDECFFPDGLLCQLRKYQEWGVKYILHQERVLLGDEMGLGKTIQAIATMVSLKNTGATHFLVICPASVITNWQREIVKHSKLRVTKVHGSGKSSAIKAWVKNGGVAVTNFESTAAFKLEDNFKFDLTIVDEAHYIKNEFAKRSINTKNIASHSDRLLFMTGTALENNVDEMISLIDVLNPDIGDSIRGVAFMALAPNFRERIAPVYYRRKREQVLTELPDKIETKEWCTLNTEEEKIYEQAVLDKQFQEARRVSWNIDDLSKSSKATRLKELIEEAKAEGRKIIVFSFFLDTIRKLHDFLKGQCLNPITGSVNVNRRQEILDEFDSAPAGTVLLAQITSGGTGLNIQSASVVIICEPQFKPSIENQAISRAYRMGQSRNVLVYRLLCEDTIDERITKLLEEKQKIFDTFADKSVAAQSVEIDNQTFGNIIDEEIERIIEKNKLKGVTIDKTKESDRNTETSNSPQKGSLCVNFPNVNTKDYYHRILTLSYNELVQELLDKYGKAKYNYFTSEDCKYKNRKVSRTNEGLYCHHIDEDKEIKLSDEKLATLYSFEYQTANRLVYCNYLEHLLLHILIFEESSNSTSNREEILGLGGIITYMCKQLNDAYNGYEFKQEWMRNTTSVITDYFDIYILMLNRLWRDIQNVPSIYIPKEALAQGWNGNIYPNILNSIK